MNPFLEIPVCLAGGKDDPEKTDIARVVPSEIAYYYPGYHWGTVIVMKSGSSFLTQWSCADVDGAIIAYNDFVQNNPNNRHNIRLERTKKSNNLKTVN